jgi:hypothetical protein
MDEDDADRAAFEGQPLQQQQQPDDLPDTGGQPYEVSQIEPDYMLLVNQIPPQDAQEVRQAYTNLLKHFSDEQYRGQPGIGFNFKALRIATDKQEVTQQDYLSAAAQHCQADDTGAALDSIISLQSFLTTVGTKAREFSTSTLIQPCLLDIERDLNLWSTRLNVLKVGTDFLRHMLTGTPVESPHLLCSMPEGLTKEMRAQRVYKTACLQRGLRVQDGFMVQEKVVDVKRPDGSMRKFHSHSWHRVPNPKHEEDKVGLSTQAFTESLLNSEDFYMHELMATDALKTNINHFLQSEPMLQAPTLLRRYMAFKSDTSAVIYDLKTEQVYEWGEGLPSKVAVCGFHEIKEDFKPHLDKKVRALSCVSLHVCWSLHAWFG